MLWTRRDLSLRDPGEVSALWLDLDQQMLFGSGLCQSLRHLSDSGVGCSAVVWAYAPINERINQIEPLLEQARSEPIVDVPAVVQFDGMCCASKPKRRPSSWTSAGANARSVKGKGRGARRAGVVDRW